MGGESSEGGGDGGGMPTVQTPVGTRHVRDVRVAPGGRAGGGAGHVKEVRVRTSDGGWQGGGGWVHA